MGGKDVIYIKQQHSSNLQPADIQKRLKDMADKRFVDANGHYSVASEQVFQSDTVCNITVNDILQIYRCKINGASNFFGNEIYIPSLIIVYLLSYLI